MRKDLGNGLSIEYLTTGDYRIHHEFASIILTSEELDAIHQYKKDVENGPNDPESY